MLRSPGVHWSDRAFLPGSDSWEMVGNLEKSQVAQVNPVSVT